MDGAIDPDEVDIEFDVESIVLIEKAQAFMKLHGINKMEQWWACGYNFFTFTDDDDDDDDRVARREPCTPEYRLSSCDLVIYEDCVKFTFSFKDSNDEVYTDKSWSVAELKALSNV